ncbi:TetR family transcriptional regulator C-terminal domain-containing protein [Wangella sp. NEAU-J3]|nr:TetR family transcriptional regulator C-terminal domain-containing protein [Jidongwangia harbinensis]
MAVRSGRVLSLRTSPSYAGPPGRRSPRTRRRPPRLRRRSTTEQADARDERDKHCQSDPRVLLRATLEELLPLDEQRRTRLRVMTAYYARSLTDPALAAVFLHREHPLEDLVTALITAAGARPSVDPAQEANLLVGGISGLGLDLLHRRRTPAGVRRTLDYHLNRILAQRS